VGRWRYLAWAFVLAPWGLVAPRARAAAVWRFTDATAEAGLASGYSDREVPDSLAQRAAGGVAAGDYDGDGRTDLYVVGGDAGRNLLYRNRGDGTFDEVGQQAGVALAGLSGSGPLFFDADGDGWLDLFVGAVGGGRVALFHNRGDGTFDDVTEASGLATAPAPANTLSATAGDYDGDGRLDLFLSHWQDPAGECHLWRNLDGTRFACADPDAGLGGLVSTVVDETFTANFADIDGDGDVDLLVTADFGHSSVWRNVGGGRFQAATTPVISDENGMGSAVGDYDGDGDLDWFVSSVFDGDGTTEGDWGTSGNRLYRNRGDGTFDDVTDAAGVRDANWGWGSSFCDFDQDGRLDLIVVNGWPQGSAQFRGSPTRLYMGRDGGRFEEQAAALQLDDRGDGRGVVCFDYDGDGDLDVFVANKGAGTNRLFRNDGGRAAGHFLDVSVRGAPPNPFAVGAVVRVTAGGRTQMREVRAGSNYASQDPLTAHFGLGDALRVDRLEVTWPGGARRAVADLDADQTVTVTPDAVQARLATRGGCGGP
jgi:hypothetical protein